jgi:hypothetical protein
MARVRIEKRRERGKGREEVPRENQHPETNGAGPMNWIR